MIRKSCKRKWIPRDTIAQMTLNKAHNIFSTI